MASPSVAGILVPLPLNYVPDSQLQEGRVLIPLAMNFANALNTLDPTGTYYTSVFTIQTGAIQSTRVFSAVKGIAIAWNGINNDVLKIKCRETQQEFVLGPYYRIDSASTGRFIVNARIPFFLPQSATLDFINYSLATEGTSTNTASLQLSNFEMRPFYQVTNNPFGNL